jgi:predicted metal-dependent hydrolase
MALFKRGGVWWYKFYFAGQQIRETSKSTSKTVAKNAEQQRRRELEAGFHNLKEVRQQRIRYLKDVIEEYLVGYSQCTPRRDRRSVRLRFAQASYGGCSACQ